VTGSDARFCWVGDDWLAVQDVTPWSEVPLWAPEAPGLFAGDTAGAAAAGMRWRPLRDTVADVWHWQRRVPGGWTAASRTPGLTPEREAELLAARPR
jgi:2'-hydroxyisoflavone reductase